MRKLARILVAAGAAATLGMVVAAAGEAGGPPSLAWSPSTGGSFDYGMVDVGHDSSQTLTLTNSGGSASSKLTISLSGSASFAITANDCKSLGPGKSCTITVSYAPTASAGPETATLSADGKKDSATADLTLTGRGVLVFVATGPFAPDLSPLNENPPHPTSSATGTTVVTWDTATTMMTVNVVFGGLTTPSTAAHIHCCTTTPGGNAGVATTVPFFPGFPIGMTSGTYAQSFDMLNAASYNPAFVTAHGMTPASAA